MLRKKVALVFPTTIEPKSFFGFLLPSLGLERLGAAVGDMARVELFDARFEKSLPDAVAAFNPDIVALNVKTTLHSARALNTGRAIRALSPNSVIVAGGLHATACPEEVLSIADLVVRGEGERAFRRIVDGEEPAAIPGTVFRLGSEIKSIPMAPPIVDLDALPPPARHLRKPHYSYSAAGLFKMDLLETSRGCTHACTFCSSGSVYPCKYRVHSPQYVHEEVRRLARAGVKYCMLTDDHFGADPDRTAEICELILRDGIRIAFFCFTRPFEGRMDLKRIMARAGFVMVSYGAESPSLDQVVKYGKGYPRQDEEFIRRVNSEWLKAGARYIGNSYVFGDPGDSAEVLSGLGVHARRLDPTYIEPLYAQPYPGTPYREEMAERGLLLDEKWDRFTEGRMLVAHPELDREALKRLRANAWIDFFSPKKAAGVFRMPLYMHRHLGMGVRKVVKYMLACDYSVFGCILEDKFYRDLHPWMIETWFRSKVRTFEEPELDMTDGFDDFTDMLGLHLLKAIAGDLDLDLAVVEEGLTLACLRIRLRSGRIANARVWPGDPARPGSTVRTARVNFSLDFLVRFMTAGSHLEKIAVCLKAAAISVTGFLHGRIAGISRAGTTSPPGGSAFSQPGADSSFPPNFGRFKETE